MQRKSKRYIVIDQRKEHRYKKGMQKLKVTCLECGESDVLTIDELQHIVVDYQGKMKTPFRSFRWRGDQQWGFYCMCSNDSRLAPSESNDFDKLVNGDPISVKEIAASLLIPDDKKFRVESL